MVNKKGTLKRLQELWYFTPIGAKAIILVLVLIVGFMLLYGNPKVEKANARLQQLEYENVQLKLKLSEQIAITDTLVSYADKKIKNFDKHRKEVENQIKIKYDEKRTIADKQPIDSAISTLSKWLSETDSK